jgi:hypothetical protein
MISDHANAAQPEQNATPARRIPRHRWPYLSAVAAAALAATVITITTGHAASAQTAPAACQSGYLCLALSPSGTGNVALIASGQSQQFPSPNGIPITEIVNNATIGYCTLSQVSGEGTDYGYIPAGTTQVISENMIAVSPGPVCP